MQRNESKRTPTRRTVLAGAGATLALGALPARAEAPGDKIRPLVLVAKTQASDPAQFQAAELIAQEWRKLGLKISMQVVTRPQMTEIIWMNRTKWDMTMWEMVGRPERSDPDELVYSLFHSSLMKSGYNFVGYENSAYDKLAEAQRAEIDPEKRRALVKQSQRLIKQDQPYVFLVHPRRSHAFNAEVWDEKTIIDEAGIGIRNFWTFIGATPKGAQKDMILNAHDTVVHVKPVRMDGIGSWVTDILWDHLVRVDPEGNPVAWAAESFKWLSPTAVEVVVRDGMTFHDGKPVTMEDVIYSFEVPAIPGKCPQFNPFVINIAAVKQTGPRTLQFELKTPQSSFMTSTLAKINIIPKHVWKPIVDGMMDKPDLIENYQEQSPIGSGPFKFVHWRRQEELVLERHAQHWAAPKMNRWILRIVPNPEATLGMLKNGELNFLAIFTGDPENVANLAKQAPQIKVITTTDLGFQFLAWNLRRPPFSDPAFRRALSTAVSRQLMAQAAWNGFAEPAGSAVSPALPYWHAEDSLLAGGDLKAARAMLKEAGYTLKGNDLHYPAGKKEELASN
jgi:peptide/nickel transport system substrate-binding protein